MPVASDLHLDQLIKEWYGARLDPNRINGYMTLHKLWAVHVIVIVLLGAFPFAAEHFVTLPALALRLGLDCLLFPCFQLGMA